MKELLRHSLLSSLSVNIIHEHELSDSVPHLLNALLFGFDSFFFNFCISSSIFFDLSSSSVESFLSGVWSSGETVKFFLELRISSRHQAENNR